MRNQFPASKRSEISRAAWTDRWIGIPAITICVLLAEITLPAATFWVTLTVLDGRGGNLLDNPEIARNAMLVAGAVLAVLDVVLVAAWMVRWVVRWMMRRRVLPECTPAWTAEPAKSEVAERVPASKFRGVAEARSREVVLHE